MFTYSNYINAIKQYDLNGYIKEKQIDNISIFHYTIYPHDKDLWNNWVLREARGISFDNSSGFIKSRPFHKFFNLREVPETKVHNIESDRFICFDKIDGSLIIIEKDKNGSLVCRTKRSYDNEQAILANTILASKSGKYKKFISDMIDDGYTPLFELQVVIPHLRVVVKYETNDLIFLAFRNNKTGKYIFSHKITGSIREELNIKEPKYFNNINDFWKYIDIIEEQENIEGCVVYCCNNKILFKYKTEWYLDRHRAKELLTSPKAFVKLFINNKLDDVYSLLSDDDKIVARKIEKICFDRYIKIINEIDDILKKDGHLDRKEFAIKYSKLPFFGILIRKYANQGYDMEKYFMNHEYPIIKEQLDNNILKEID